MHARVKQVVELKHAGKAGEAEQEFTRVCEAAEGVIALIDGVEAQVIGSRVTGADSPAPRNVRTIRTRGQLVERN